MPLEYRIDQLQGTVTITGDYVTADEWVTLFNRVEQDPRFRPGLTFIRDLRGSLHQVSVDTVIGSVAIVREFWNRLGVRRAAIITGPVIDNPTLIISALADHYEIPIRVFGSDAEARSWLESPE